MWAPAIGPLVPASGIPISTGFHSEPPVHPLRGAYYPRPRNHP